eukprot:CAMPEP_0118945236 /NCGR_PEP_ID=MMETSP1169-20130426/41859_1 /TAXON_ID=36882 /ORGANISM="Pyramimonas obovata, Strain CCMP722" /LENGTH=201 /DNA_ID=CAMNT_0006890899 /DNA_START=248 /DNA_END=850 /DNA_ORIENTATION=+
MSTKKPSMLSRVSRASGQNENAFRDKEAGDKSFPATRNRLALKDLTNKTPAKQEADENVTPKKIPYSQTIGRNRGTKGTTAITPTTQLSPSENVGVAKHDASHGVKSIWQKTEDRIKASMNRLQVKGLTCYQADQILLGRVLGEGAFATVHLAQVPSADGRVGQGSPAKGLKMAAAKRTLVEDADDPDELEHALQALEQEA